MLAPFQQAVCDQLTQMLPYTYLIDFYGSPGSGKTTVLKELRKQVPGWLLHAHDIVDFFERETGRVRLDVLNPSWIRARCRADRLG